jgi:hypothetical protein
MPSGLEAGTDQRAPPAVAPAMPEPSTNSSAVCNPARTTSSWKNAKTP